jgi:hypothetical protein
MNLPTSILVLGAPIRFSFLIAGLIISAPVGLYAGPASANAAAWCARVNTGAGRVQENCIFNSIEACRRTVLSGNRGFCTRNPAFRKTKSVYGQ